MNTNKRSYRENLSLGDISVNVDAEAFWPPLAARYNITLQDVCEVIWTAEGCIHPSEVYDYIEDYILNFVLSETLWGRDVMDSLIALDKKRTIEACRAAYQKPIPYMEGMDHVYLDQWLMALLKGWTETEQIAHHHLAAFICHYVWQVRDYDKVKQELQILCSVLEPHEGKKEECSNVFVCYGFTRALFRSFERVLQTPSIKVLSHGTRATGIHSLSRSQQARIGHHHS